jgi:hypothetical protein
VLPRTAHRNTSHWQIGVLLIAFAFQALIPRGYMPSADRPFTLQLCPDGLPARLLEPAADSHAAHHAHQADHPHDSLHAHAAADDDAHHEPGEPATQHESSFSQFCAFGAAAGVAGPLPHALIAFVAPHAPARLVPVEAFRPRAARSVRTQQPRAPPVLA